MNWSESYLFRESKDGGDCKTEDRTSNCAPSKQGEVYGCCCEANDSGNQAPGNRKLDHYL